MIFLFLFHKDTTLRQILEVFLSWLKSAAPPTSSCSFSHTGLQLWVDSGCLVCTHYCCNHCDHKFAHAISFLFQGCHLRIKNCQIFWGWCLVTVVSHLLFCDPWLKMSSSFIPSFTRGLYSTDSCVIRTFLCKVEGKEETSLGVSQACGRCEVLSALWQGHNSEAKVKEIDSAARRNSTTLKCEGQKREVHLGNYLILYRAGKLSALCTSPITICCL